MSPFNNIKRNIIERNKYNPSAPHLAERGYIPNTRQTVKYKDDLVIDEKGNTHIVTY